MIHLSARFLGLLAVLSFASINVPLSSGVALDVRHHTHHDSINDASGSTSRHHGAHSKHSIDPRKKASTHSTSLSAATARSSTAPVAVKAVQLPLPAKMKANKVNARAASLLLQSEGLPYLLNDMDVTVHGEGDLVRVGDHVFSSRILGRRRSASLSTRSPHHHDHSGYDYTKVIINGDNDRVRIHDSDRHHHHGDDDYTKVVVNGDNDRVRVHNRALEMQVGVGEGSPLVIAHVGRRGVVEVDGDNHTVEAKETTKLTGSIDIVSLLAGGAEKLGPRIASLFLNQGTSSSDGSVYPLDASTTNHTQVTIIAQAPIPGMEESLLKIGPHEVPVVMEIEVFDSKALQHTSWCATYDSRPSVATPLLAKPCATGNKGDSHEDQRFLWNSQTQIIRPIFLPDANLPAIKAKDAEDQLSTSSTSPSTPSSATPTQSENDFPTYEDGKEYNWPKPGEDSVDAKAEEDDTAPDVAKVAAYQSTYSRNSSRPPIMVAAAAASSPSSSSTTPATSTSVSSHMITPTLGAVAQKRGAGEGKSVVMVFKPDVPIVGAKEVSSNPTSSFATSASFSVTSTNVIDAKAAASTTSGSTSITATASVTSSLVAAEADVTSSTDPTSSSSSSSTISSSGSLVAAQTPISSSFASETLASTSTVMSTVSGLAAAGATSESALGSISASYSGTESTSLSSTTSLVAAAEATILSSSNSALIPSASINSSTALDVAEATVTPVVSDSTSTSTVTETHTVIGAKEASTGGILSSSATSTQPTATAAGVLDVKLVSDEPTSSITSSASSSQDSALASSTPTPSLA